MRLTVIQQRQAPGASHDSRPVEPQGENALADAAWIFHVELVSCGSVSKHHLKVWPAFGNARVEIQERALDMQPQDAFDTGPLHPAGRAGIPAPTTTPDMGGGGVDIGG